MAKCYRGSRERELGLAVYFALSSGKLSSSFYGYFSLLLKSHRSFRCMFMQKLLHGLHESHFLKGNFWKGVNRRNYNPCCYAWSCGLNWYSSSVPTYQPKCLLSTSISSPGARDCQVTWRHFWDVFPRYNRSRKYQYVPEYIAWVCSSSGLMYLFLWEHRPIYRSSI